MNAKALWGRAVRIGAPVAAALALALAMAFWLHAGAPLASAVAAEAPMAHHGHGVEHGAHAMANGAAALLERRSGSGGHAGCADGGCEKFQCCFGVFTALSSPWGEARIAVASEAPVAALTLPSLSRDPADQPPKRL